MYTNHVRRDRRLGAVEDRALSLWLQRDEGAGRGRVILALKPHRRIALDDDVALDLAAPGLVVLGHLPSWRDLDQVEAEGRGAERFARQLPGAVPRALHRLELVAMLDRVAVAHLAPRAVSDSSRVRRRSWPAPSACRRRRERLRRRGPTPARNRRWRRGRA